MGTLWKVKLFVRVIAVFYFPQIFVMVMFSHRGNTTYYLWKPATTYIVSSKTQAADPLHFVGISPVVRWKIFGHYQNGYSIVICREYSNQLTDKIWTWTVQLLVKL